jgi:hypothetical protein
LDKRVSLIKNKNGYGFIKKYFVVMPDPGLLPAGADLIRHPGGQEIQTTWILAFARMTTEEVLVPIGYLYSG